MIGICDKTSFGKTAVRRASRAFARGPKGAEGDTDSGRRGSPKGFMLMEVLLVVIILSVSLTMIVSSLLTCLNGIGQIQDYTQAVFLLDNKLSEILMAPDPDVPGEGTFDAPLDRFNYRMRAQRFEQDDAAEKEALQRINVEISWTSRGTVKKINADLLAFERDR